jgi:hypothetical protein
VDEYLVAIVEAVEKGEEFPPLRVVAGNTLFVGTPGSPRHFANQAQWALGEDYFESNKGGGALSRAKRAAMYQDAKTYAESAVRPLSATVAESEGRRDALTLYQCQVWPASGGDGVHVPVVRIPFDSIDGWWPGSGKRLSGGQQWFFGVGALIPLDVG